MPYHYLLHRPFLEITCSDSEQECVDERRIRDLNNHPDGRERNYVPQSNDSRASKRWRKKLGKELASKFLLKSANVDYILAKFPKSYFLYSHEKGLNHEVDRADVYLFSDDLKFRSAEEFVPHAAWLIAGMPEGRCKCQYCSPRPQKAINNELKAGFEKAVNDEAKRRYQVQKNGGRYTPRQPLDEVYLKTLPDSDLGAHTEDSAA